MTARNYVSTVRLLSRRPGLLQSCHHHQLASRRCRRHASISTLYPAGCQTARYLSTSARHTLNTQDVFPSQLDQLPASILQQQSKPLITPQTLTEKIVQRHSVGLPLEKRVQSGDYVTLEPFHCMTHDNSWPVATKFMSIGASRIKDNRQIVMTLDHDVQNKSEANLKKYKQIEEFAKSQGVDFYPAGRGIGHQIMVEEGYAFPGQLVVASDSHSNMYGGIGCLGTPVVRTDAASIWATKKTWWQIPPVARVHLLGSLPVGVSGKDVIVALCGLFNKDEVLNHCIEFQGPALATLPVDDRLAIANMTTEWGALSGIFPIDSVLEGWLRYKATEAAMYPDSIPGVNQKSSRFSHERIAALLADRTGLQADRGAKYAKDLYIDLSTLTPHVSGPNSVKISTPLSELAASNIRLDRAYLVSCTNSRASDISAAANVFRKAADQAADKKIPRIPSHVNFYIAAASLPEQRAAEEQGDWGVLLEAGAKELPSGCGPCIGLGTGLLEPGEVGISASNRNFKGRMGSTDAKAFLASPEVVAASALAGTITGSGSYTTPDGWSGVKFGEGDGIKEEDRIITIDEALERIIADADAVVSAAEETMGAEKSASTSDSPSATPANISSSSNEQLTPILPGFASRIKGEIVFCDADNINTDAIYPGKYTYQDNITPAKMAEVVMENYDAKFASSVRSDGSDILVTGFNTGCGSSREQAATALLAKGIRLVVAGSFGNIFGRNSVNNGLLGLEVPDLIKRLREAFPPNGNDGKVPTRRTGWTVEWDVARSQVTITEEGGKVWTKKVGEIPPNVQEIFVAGGLEKWVKGQIENES